MLLVPKVICTQFENLIARFWWNSSEDGQNYALVKEMANLVSEILNASI